MKWKTKMLLQLTQMEKANEAIYSRAEKTSYFLPRGFLQSVVQSGKQIHELKLAVANGTVIREANSQLP